MRRHFLSAALGILLSQAAVANVPTGPTLVGKVVPFQRWTPLGAKTIGLLAQREIAGVCQIDHGQGVRQVAPASAYPCAAAENTYTYMQEVASPVAVYFKSEGQGYNFLKNWKLSNGFQADAAQFSKTTPNRWDLSREAHLVDVQVNGGMGSEGDVHFIVTDAKVLDGTFAFPLSPEALLKGFLAPYGNENSVQTKQAARRLETAVKALEAKHPRFKALQGLARTTPSFAGYSATWLSDAKRLRVVYYRRYEDRYTKTITKPPFQKPCPPGAPCLPPPPPFAFPVTATFGAELAIEVEYRADGHVQSVTGHPAQAYFADFPPGTPQK